MTNPKHLKRTGDFGPFDGTQRSKKISYAENGELIKKASAGEAGGQIKTILQDIGEHLLYHLSGDGFFGGFNLKDVRVFLPIVESARITGSRYGPTAMLLANNMKATNYPLKPGVFRQRYQLPIVFTIFAQNANRMDDAIKGSPTISHYDLLTFIPAAMQEYDGSRYGVLRVTVQNTQISRNPLNIEKYDEIIQCNMIVNGIIDYSSYDSNAPRRVIAELENVDIFREITQRGKSGIDSKAPLASVSVTGRGLDGASVTGVLRPSVSESTTLSGAMSKSSEIQSRVWQNDYEVHIDYGDMSSDELKRKITITDAVKLTSENSDSLYQRKVIVSDKNTSHFDNVFTLSEGKDSITRVFVSDFDTNADYDQNSYQSRVTFTEKWREQSNKGDEEIARVVSEVSQRPERELNSTLVEAISPLIFSQGRQIESTSLVKESDNNGSTEGNVFGNGIIVSQYVISTYNQSYYDLISRVDPGLGRINNAFYANSTINISQSSTKASGIFEEAGKIIVKEDSFYNNKKTLENIIGRATLIGSDRERLK